MQGVETTEATPKGLRQSPAELWNICFYGFLVMLGYNLPWEHHVPSIPLAASGTSQQSTGRKSNHGAALPPALGMTR